LRVSSFLLNISPIIEHFPYVGLLILLILGGIGLPFPEDTTLILCGFLISNEVVKPIPALFVVYSGLLITDFFLYSIGKKYGHNVVHHEKFQKIISPARLLKLEEKFHKGEILFILFGRHLVGLRAQIFIVSGVMKMNPLKFLITDAFSSLFTIALMVGAGYVGGNSLQVIKKDITKVEHIAILLILFLIVIFIFYKFYRYRHHKDFRAKT
jgi:membrane protein DedA with SNARE-associated domain